MIDVKNLEIEFGNYTKSYKDYDDGVELKIVHTKKVAEHCKNIAEKLSLTKDDIILAWTIGMLHDIGRFEQLKRFHTFRDEKSINHASFGVELLFCEGLIDRFIKDYNKEEYEIIRASIYNHNLIEIEKQLTEREILFSKIIRDADKLDIFRVCALDDSKLVYGGSKQEIENSDISEDVYKLALKKQSIPYSFRKTLADDLVCHLAFIWDLNFEVSKIIAFEQGYYKQMTNFHFNDTYTQSKYNNLLSLIF